MLDKLNQIEKHKIVIVAALTVMFCILTYYFHMIRGIGTVEEWNKIMKYLWREGFEPVLLEDSSVYTVKIDRFKKYAAILKNSIDYDEKGKERIFVRKDLVSTDEAIEKEGEKVL